MNHTIFWSTKNVENPNDWNDFNGIGFLSWYEGLVDLIEQCLKIEKLTIYAIRISEDIYLEIMKEFEKFFGDENIERDFKDFWLRTRWGNFRIRVDKNLRDDSLQIDLT